MAWRKRLTPSDNEIIIGCEHPMRYAWSIAVLAHKFGACKIYVRRNKSFIDKFGRQKTILDQWKDVGKFIFGQANMKIVHEDNDDNNDMLIYVVEW